MSESEQKPAPRPPRDPVALSTEYHKARKQLMLWAGILFIWELVGIDLEKAKETEGNVGALVKSIKSPQAVPWVLLVLVGYFLFKLWIEWSQCESNRRKIWAARVDFGSAWIVTALAYILYTYQAISRIQFADVLQSSNKWQSFTFAFPLGVICTMSLILFRRLRQYSEPVTKWDKLRRGVFIVTISMALVIFVIAVLRGVLNWEFALIGIALGGTSAFLIDQSFKRYSGLSKT
jgi:hypothetical protein